MVTQIKLYAYWPGRTPDLGRCKVTLLDFENDKAEIFNGTVRVFPKISQLKIYQETPLGDMEVEFPRIKTIGK